MNTGKCQLCWFMCFSFETTEKNSEKKMKWNVLSNSVYLSGLKRLGFVVADTRRC